MHFCLLHRDLWINCSCKWAVSQLVKTFKADPPATMSALSLHFCKGVHFFVNLPRTQMMAGPLKSTAKEASGFTCLAWMSFGKYWKRLHTKIAVIGCY